MPVASRARPPFKGQPVNGRRLEINPAHWLAKRLIFAHTGRDALFYGERLLPIENTLPQNRGASTAAPGSPFEESLNFVPDGSGYQVYATPGHRGQNITAAAWVANSANFGAVSGLLISGNWGNSAAQGFQTGASTRSLRAGSYGASSGIASATTEGALPSSNNVWKHGITAFASNTSRVLFVDGALSSSNTTSIASTATHDRIAVAALARGGSVTLPALSQLSGIALPLLIEGAFSANESARLYEEQRTNPWALFRERPRQIWLGAAAGFPTITLPRAKAGSATPTGFVPQWTAS